MAEKRVYLVIDDQGEERMVKAASQAQAVRQVTDSKYTVKAASATEVVDFFLSGGTLEEAGKEPVEEEAEK